MTFSIFDTVRFNGNKSCKCGVPGDLYGYVGRRFKDTGRYRVFIDSASRDRRIGCDDCIDLVSSGNTPYHGDIVVGRKRCHWCGGDAHVGQKMEIVEVRKANTERPRFIAKFMDKQRWGCCPLCVDIVSIAGTNAQVAPASSAWSQPTSGSFRISKPKPLRLNSDL